MMMNVVCHLKLIWQSIIKNETLAQFTQMEEKEEGENKGVYKVTTKRQTQGL